MKRGDCVMHCAPWNNHFHTFYCNGHFAHEVQIGYTVFQWAHKGLTTQQRRWHRKAIGFTFGRLLVWRASL